MNFTVLKKSFEKREMVGSSLKDKFNMIRSSSVKREGATQDWADSKEAGTWSKLILKDDWVRVQQGAELCAPTLQCLHS